jgi:hypothetical protein
MRVCIIDDREDLPAPPFLQDAFEALGHITATVFSCGKNSSSLQHTLEKTDADLFVAFQTIGFLAASALCAPSLTSKRVALLFYDDPLSTFLLFGKEHPFFKNRRDVFFFIWDGYWRRAFESMTGKSSFATHLAAETKYFSPEKKDLIPQIRHCAAFLGNIPADAALQKWEGELPESHRRVALALKSRIASDVYAANPFEILNRCLGEMKEGAEILEETERSLQSLPDLSRPLAPHIQLRRLAWQYGKRETRLRAVRAVAQAAPLAILSNLKETHAAGEDELRGLLKSSHDLLFIDTSQASYYQLAHLYASGRFHFQSTDPQSVEGGIPYRVFQCAACATPLVSDAKKELKEAFEPEKEILLYETDRDLPSVIERAMRGPERMREMGKAAHRRFLNEHTWTHRMRHLLDCLDRY